MQLCDSVFDGGHIGAVVVETAVALLHHERDLLARDVDALGALVQLDEALLVQLVDHAGDERVVEALSELLDCGAESFVDFRVFDSGKLADDLPGVEALLVARLQEDHRFLRAEG